MKDEQMGYNITSYRLCSNAFVVIPAVVLLTLTCSGPKQGAVQRRKFEATIEVQNQSWLDMRIYVLRASHRTLLGLVTGSSTRVFTIPSDLIFGSTSLRFIADPVGSRRPSVRQSMCFRETKSRW
ncbi:hypothetical protein MJD09_22060 [bacterium]|nr:hypothetical protein [bacterium]